MAKINLLTIQFNKSYGAVMQTYATCKLLENAGHEVTVINLQNKGKKSFVSRLKHVTKLVNDYQFWSFRHTYFSKLTSKGYCINDIKIPDADYTIVGSDQVWNRDITGKFGLSFFLDFVPDYQKRISFSSSFGKGEWEEDSVYTNKVKDELVKFHKVSVREDSGVIILKDKFGIDAYQIQDPTLCLGDFDKFVKTDKSVNQVFPFLFGNASNKDVELIANELRLPLFKHSWYSFHFKNGPINWLNNIKRSKFIVTNSFHGLALSIIFHKNFFVFCADKKKFTRIQSLLTLLGLEERFVKSFEDFKMRKDELTADIDYTHVDEILSKERKKCKEFISSIS